MVVTVVVTVVVTSFLWVATLVTVVRHCGQWYAGFKRAR
jgi:hypothetical protein